jgi:hypothetical protein
VAQCGNNKRVLSPLVDLTDYNEGDESEKRVHWSGMLHMAVMPLARLSVPPRYAPSLHPPHLRASRTVCSGQCRRDVFVPNGQDASTPARRAIYTAEKVFTMRGWRGIGHP